MTFSEKKVRNTQVCFSLHILKGANPEENLIFKELFLIKSVKGADIGKYCFSPKIKSHTV